MAKRVSSKRFIGEMQRLDRWADGQANRSGFFGTFNKIARNGRGNSFRCASYIYVAIIEGATQAIHSHAASGGASRDEAIAMVALIVCRMRLLHKKIHEVQEKYRKRMRCTVIRYADHDFDN